ncbi:MULTISPECIES: hypothetical protein [unclassified Burkholderia]|uniref:hypothetical protein n=1 Tax=unclassified Burkholderia TaxID=2613784 RepID=UPI000AD4B733|nr:MULTISPECIES: hypothetical protein [unclassified Burkholderia]
MFNGALFIFEILVVALIIIASIIEAIQHDGLRKWYWMTCAFMSLAGTIGTAYILMFPLKSAGNMGNSASTAHLAIISISFTCIGTLLSLLGMIHSSIGRLTKKS